MKLLKYIIASVLTVFPGLLVYAQKPTHAPKGDHPPTDFSLPENIIIFFVIPLIFIILYFLWRNKEKKKRENHGRDQN